MEKFIYSQSYRDDELGVVHIVVRSNARRFIARWKDSEAHITVPALTTLEQYNRVMADLKPRILAMRPTSSGFLYDGWTFANDLFKIEVVCDETLHSMHTYSGISLKDRERNKYYVRVSNDWDFSSAKGIDLLKDHFNKISEFVTKKYVLQEALQEAEALGLAAKIKKLKVGRGAVRLGCCCKAKGEVSLSRRLAFLPKELRRHVITHELAHLTHADHSDAFHALWARYEGPENKANRKAIKAFKWPI